MALVVVGLSAGGLHPLEMLLRALPDAFPAALVVAQHFGGASGLPWLLQRWLGRPVVRAATQGTLLAAGQVYVCPPRRHVVVNPDGRIATSERGRIELVQPSIDWLFESAAATYRHHTVAVVLSGANRDGARGAACVRRAGGTVIVQHPSTCTHPRMPLAAIEAGCVDRVERPDALAIAVLETLATIDLDAFRAAWEQPFAQPA